MIRIRFVGYTGLVARLIREHSYGFWATHTDAILDDGRKLGADFDGVLERPADYDQGQITEELVLELECDADTQKAFLGFLERQIGKPYDTLAITGFVSHRNWQRPDSWFCSELMAAALLECGYLRPLATQVNKITPRDLLLILSGRVGAGTITAKGHVT